MIQAGVEIAKDPKKALRSPEILKKLRVPQIAIDMMQIGVAFSKDPVKALSRKETLEKVIK